MQLLVPVYIGSFVLLTLWGIHTETALGVPRWKVALGAIAAGVGAAGMIFFWRDAVTPELSTLWKGVFPALVVQSVIDGAWDLRHGLGKMDPDGELRGDGGRTLVVVSFAAGILVLAPYLYINYRVAFG